MSSPAVYKPACVHAAKRRIESLRQANSVLEQQFMCLSRIRTPLAHLGNCWEMDREVIFKVAAGSLDTAIDGIEQMRSFLAQVRAGPELNADIATFLDRSGAWIRGNRIQFPDAMRTVLSSGRWAADAPAQLDPAQLSRPAQRTGCLAP